MPKSDADEIEMKNLVDFVLSLVGLDVYRISERSFICQLGFQEGVLSVKDFRIAVSYSEYQSFRLQITARDIIKSPAK